MSTFQCIVRYRVSPGTVSVALLGFSTVWLIGAVAYLQSSDFGKESAATPLLWALIVMVTPAICFSGSLILIDARTDSGYARLRWCALAAAFLPVTLGTLLACWVVRVMFLMTGAIS
jgi:hypothetical protein